MPAPPPVRGTPPEAMGAAGGGWPVSRARADSVRVEGDAGPTTTAATSTSRAAATNGTYQTAKAPPHRRRRRDTAVAPTAGGHGGASGAGKGGGNRQRDRVEAGEGGWSLCLPHGGTRDGWVEGGPLGQTRAARPSRRGAGSSAVGRVTPARRGRGRGGCRARQMTRHGWPRWAVPISRRWGGCGWWVGVVGARPAGALQRPAGPRRQPLEAVEVGISARDCRCAVIVNHHIDSLTSSSLSA